MDFFLGLFGKDIKKYKGFISLTGRAYRKRESILATLKRKYSKWYSIRPDFTAGLGRIEIIARK